MSLLNEYKNVWVYIEQRDGKIMDVALELLGEGNRLAQDLCSISGEDNASKVCGVLIGNKTDRLIDELYKYGADEVIQIDHKLLNKYTTDAYAKVMTDAIRKYKPEIVLMGATHIGRDLAPRVAGRLDTGLTADCTKLDIKTDKYIKYLDEYTTAGIAGLDENDKDTGLKQTRPAFGGNLMATIITPDTRPQMATVRPGVMDKLKKQENAKGKLVKFEPSLSEDDINVQIIDIIKEVEEHVSLTDADIICAGGRGLGDASGFELIEKLADKVGGAIGASRASVDSGWISHSHQIGQTGVTVKPKIYFACGISGAIQHLAGMQNSDIIIAINKDPDAPIMETADYAICGDLKKVIPEIINQWNTHMFDS